MNICIHSNNLFIPLFLYYLYRFLSCTLESRHGAHIEVDELIAVAGLANEHIDTPRTKFIILRRTPAMFK